LRSLAGRPGLWPALPAIVAEQQGRQYYFNHAKSSNNNTSWTTHRQRGIDRNDAGPQGLHVLVIFKPVLLPRGVIPVN
jgi:hypothetical protein